MGCQRDCPLFKNSMHFKVVCFTELEGGSAAKKGNFVFGSAPADNGGFKFGDAKPAASTGGTPSFSFGQSSTPAFGSNPATSTTTGGSLSHLGCLTMSVFVSKV